MDVATRSVLLTLSKFNTSDNCQVYFGCVWMKCLAQHWTFTVIYCHGFHFFLSSFFKLRAASFNGWNWQVRLSASGKTSALIYIWTTSGGCSINDKNGVQRHSGKGRCFVVGKGKYLVVLRLVSVTSFYCSLDSFSINCLALMTSEAVFFATTKFSFITFRLCHQSYTENQG